MINKRIVYTNADGVCCIITPAIECGLSIDEIARKDVPNGLSYRIIDAGQLPADRVFRNAWTDEYNTETVDVHLDKAKEIKKDKMRDLRKPLMDHCDIEFMKAVEVGDEDMKQCIIARKQELRNVTKLKLPDDIEELKAFHPEILR